MRQQVNTNPTSMTRMGIAIPAMYSVPPSTSTRYSIGTLFLLSDCGVLGDEHVLVQNGLVNFVSEVQHRGFQCLASQPPRRS